MSVTSIQMVPPEVMNMIYGYLEANDIKNCRLVCQLWRNATQVQLDARFAVQLQKTVNSGGGIVKAVAETIKSLRPGEFKNVVVSIRPQLTFTNYFKDTLTSLTLKNVCFKNMNEVRRVLFYTFKALKEVGLDSVRIFDVEVDIERLETISKVQKLEITRIHSYRSGEELFSVWNFDEIVQNYKHSLMDIEIVQEPHCKYRLAIFSLLQANKIQLVNLLFDGFKRGDDTACFKTYFEEHGSSLRKLVIGSDQFNLFSSWFGNAGTAKLKALEYLKIDEQDWSIWPGGNLENLKVLCMTQSSWNSFDFLTKMPNLKSVEMSYGRVIDNASRRTYPQVDQLTLAYNGGNRLSSLAGLFPNITKLTLNNESGGGLRGRSIFENIRVAWPNLMYLEMRGNWGLYLSGFAPISFDDIAVYGDGVPNGLGNENLAEYQNLLLFPNLRSFVHNDEHSTDVWYGDECARQVFYNHPSLKILKIGRCSISQEVIDELRSRSIVVAYKIRN